VASPETSSAPSPVASTVAEPAGFPTFGTSRGSGLARGKRAASAAPVAATKNETAGEYKPTAIQVVTTEREYKNPFAPEMPAVSEVAPVAASAVPAAPVASVAAEIPVKPAPVSAAPESAPTAAPAAIEAPETKAELKILPPEDRQQPAQSWESSTFPENKSTPAAERPTFRVDRREQRDPREQREQRDPRENVPGREPLANGENRERDFRRDNRGPRDPRESREPRDNRESREPRQPRDQREPREPRVPRDNRGEFRDQREARPLSARPLPTPPAPKKTGFFGWLKNLFAGSPAPEKTAETPAPNRSDERQGEDGQRRHHHHRGGRGGGRSGYRDQRGPRENREGGPNPNTGVENEGGERRFEGGQRRRRHRGGRGRGGFDNRGGDSRPDQGGPSGH